MQKSLDKTTERKFVRNILLKALALFVILNLVFALSDPLPSLGRISAYNLLFPGRLRLPYGDLPDLAYNLSLFQMDAMFASHEIAGSDVTTGEYRVVVIGDSASWGFLLKPEETITAQINDAKYITADGRQVKTYNLGYPTMSLMKDLLMLERALVFKPDMVVWLVTLESFPREKQLSSPILQHNPVPARNLIRKYALGLDVNDPVFVNPTFWEQTIAGNRRAMADLLRLQYYGVLWAATGIDQFYPSTYEVRMEDLPADETFHEFEPPSLPPDALAFDVLDAGVELAGEIPVLIVNEPVFVSHGENSDIRYNYYYPRWTYDQYREDMAQLSQSQDWFYLDLWNAVPPSEFTNTAIHLTPSGSALLADLIGEAILQHANSSTH